MKTENDQAWMSNLIRYLKDKSWAQEHVGQGRKKLDDHKGKNGGYGSCLFIKNFKF